MRALLAERAFPVNDIRFFASARSAGASCRGGAARSSWRTPPPPTSPGSTSPCSPTGRPRRCELRPAVAAAGADRGRQLLGLADGPGRTARGRGGEPTTRSDPPQGHRRQPQLHDDGRDAGARAAAPAAGLVRLQVATYQAVSGSGGAGVAELDEQVRSCRRPGRRLAFDGRAVDVPAPPSTPGRSPTTSCRWPARSSTTARARPTRSRSSATSRRKILHLPDLLVAGTCVRVPVFTGHSLAINAEFADAVGPEQATGCSPPPRRGADRRPDPARRRRSDPSYVGRIREDQSVPDGKGLVLFVSQRQPAQGGRAERGPDRRAGRSPAGQRRAGWRPWGRSVRRGRPRAHPSGDPRCGGDGGDVLSGLFRAGWNDGPHHRYRPAPERQAELEAKYGDHH